MFCNRFGIEVTDARKAHMVSSFREFEAEQAKTEKPVELVRLIESADWLYTRNEAALQQALEAAGIQPLAEQVMPVASRSPELLEAERAPARRRREPELSSQPTNQSEKRRQGGNRRGISKETVDEIKSRVSLLDIARERMQLTKRGGNYVGCCPFHNEKTPSFTVYTGNDSFYCYGCGEGGDAITFIRKLDNLSYPEAVQQLAERAGISISSEDISASQAEKELQNRIRECNREAARYYFQTLTKAPEGSTARKYLMGERQMAESSIRHFGLGYATNDFFKLVNHLRKMGFTDEEMIAANLAFQSKAGRIIDRFRERIMFPIFDASGNVIGFGGRALGDEKPKYLNTNTTPVFQKSNELFALNFARKSRPEQLILAEGYMDVIALHAAGFTTAVASLGTALTEQHGRTLARYAKEVIICYDSDTAGQKATLKAISVLRANGVKVKVAQIPDAKDPDEFLKRYPQDGQERLQAIFNAAPNDTEYRLMQCKNGLDVETPAGKLAYMEAAVGVLASLSDAVERDIYADLLSRKTGISKESILQQTGIERVENRNSVPVSEEEPMSEDEPTRRFRAWIRPDMNEESSIVAWADVVINEDFRVNSIRLVLEEDNTFSLLMPAYKPRGKDEFVPLVEMDPGAEHELTQFLTQNLDMTKAVEVVGGGTAIDVGETKMELHKTYSRGSVLAYIDMENSVLKLKAAKIIEGKRGVFLATPDTGKIKTGDGQEQYRYVYEL
ncbi:MAG: DNA primase, partial [Oscillospiraceae bacterium]